MINKTMETLLEKAVEVTATGHKAMNMEKSAEHYDKLYNHFQKHYDKEKLIAYIEFIESVTPKAEEASAAEVNAPKVFDKDHPAMKLGKEGERKTVEFLMTKGLKVYDMSDEEEYRAIDTDFVIENDKNEQLLLETKASNSPVDEGKLIVELFNDITPGRPKYPGWLKKCQADILNVYSKGKKVDAEYIYFYSTQQMKDYVAEVGKYYKEAGLALPEKWSKTPTNNSSIPKTHKVTGFTNTEWKHKFERYTTAHCLKVDINNYVATGRFLDIVDYRTGKLIYSSEGM